MATMKAAYLPGNSTVELREVPIPEPGHGQVLIRMQASTICGSDIRAIYREHTGVGPEGYQGVIAGHEPCGIVERTGPGMRRFGVGDRVIIYHISGCGLCVDCRRGYMISCTSPLRAAYGWQRDGGMAPFMLADEKDLIPLPDELSYLDGAQLACGFGTVYEGLEKARVSGNDRILVTGLGPVGLATLMLARALGAGPLVGTDLNPERVRLARDLGLADAVFVTEDDALERVREAAGGGVDCAIDCSGADPARQLAVRATAAYGRVVLLGEGGTLSFAPSPDLLHGQKTIYGSWVTSTWRMEELAVRIARWGIHPEDLVTHRFPLDQAAAAYELMDAGNCGKVAVVFDEA